MLGLGVRQVPNGDGGLRGRRAAEAALAHRLV